MSLYLKYRPSNFESIVGQEHIKDILKAEIDQNKINSSYIFFGPRGTGKTSSARIFAKAINCLSNGEKPCNNCESCNLINSGKTLDFIEIDAASNTQVDKIREEIIDKAVYPPTNLQKKIYIIDEVHMLSKSAFNALLKIMEEPPEYLIFILATTEIHKVPETIVSRCEVFNFKRISRENIVNRLKYISEKENISFTDEGLDLIAKISDGGLRDAIKYLEQVSIIGEVDGVNVSKFLGIAPERQIIDFISISKTGNLNKIFSYIEDLKNNGIDLSNFIKDVLLYIDEHLQEDIENNLKLIDLFDEIYQNIRDFPSPILAYKKVLGSYYIGLNSGNNNSLTKGIENTSKDYSNNKFLNKPETIENNILELEGNLEDENDIKDNNTNKDLDNLSLNKENLLSVISSPIIKGIIKNFGHIDFKDGLLEIIIISKTNYDILTKEDKIKILTDDIKKNFGDIRFEVKFMSKEEYFRKQLQS